MKNKTKPKMKFEDLDFVDKNEEEHTLKAVLYGKPGAGKTTFACTFPKPCLLVDVKGEKGYGIVKKLKGVQPVKVNTLEEIYAVYWGLKENKQKYKTVVIDTVTNLQDLVLEDLRQRKKQKLDPDKIGKWGTMSKSDWGEVSSTLKSLITDFRDLEMNVIFISHERVFNAGDDEDDDDRIDPSIGPRVMPSVSSTMLAAVDIIGNCFIREHLTKDKRSEMQYCLRVGPHPLYITKIRVPKDQDVSKLIIDPSYDDLIDLIEGE